jgi:hypothetical protein
MGGGYLTQPFYHMAPRQTMPYSTSDFGLKKMQRPGQSRHGEKADEPATSSSRLFLLILVS